MKPSPTALTNNWFKQRGHQSQTVEHYNAFAKKRKDLFDIIDIVAMTSTMIYGIQATTWTNVQARCKKSLSRTGLRSWLQCGGMFQVWGWRKTKKTEPGHKQGDYVARVRQAIVTSNGEVVFREIDQAFI